MSYPETTRASGKIVKVTFASSNRPGRSIAVGDIVLVVAPGHWNGMTIRVDRIYDSLLMTGFNGYQQEMTFSILDVCLLGRPTGASHA